jgi:hypothetical protein
MDINKKIDLYDITEYNINNNSRFILNNMYIHKFVDYIFEIIRDKYRNNNKLKFNFILIDMANYRNKTPKNYNQCYSEFNNYAINNDTPLIKHIFIIINSYYNEIKNFTHIIFNRNRELNFIIKNYDNFYNNRYDDFYYENMFEFNLDCYQDYDKNNSYYKTFHEFDDYLILLSYYYINELKEKNKIINDVNVISNDEYTNPINKIKQYLNINIVLKNGSCSFNSINLNCSKINNIILEDDEKRINRKKRFELSVPTHLLGGYYDKYLKYKNKYLTLKNFNNL